MFLTAKNIILLTLAIFCWVNIFSQQPAFRVTNYDETAGLQSSAINTMLQDSRGYLWFGTADGLCRFDGYNFKTFQKIAGEKNSLPGNFIVQLAEDHDGKIWIGFLKDGISCYDPATGIFKNYDVSKVDSTTPYTVSTLFVDNENNVWAGMQQKGFIKLDKTTGKYTHYNIIADTSTFYPKDLKVAYNTLHAMYEESKGIYWLATHDGLYRFNAATKDMQPVRAKAIQKNAARDDLFNSIVKDKNGLWLSSWAGGLSYYDITTNKWSNFKLNSMYKNETISNIILGLKSKNENELWVTSLDKGLGIFNKTTRRFSFFSDDSSTRSLIPGKFCYLVMQDKQNNLWATCADGLLKIEPSDQKFSFAPVKPIKAIHEQIYITCILEDKAGKYLFTGTAFGDGLHVTNKRSGKTQSILFDTIPIEGAMAVTDMMQDSKGIIWIVTRDYIYQYDTLRNKLVSVPQPPLAYMNGIRSNFFSAIKEDKKGKMWIATARNGIFCYDPVTKTYEHFYNNSSSKKSLPSNVVQVLSIDGAGRVWVGGSRGCFGYLDDSLNFINLDGHNKPFPKNFDTRISVLYTDRNGDIWSGSNAGLFYFDTHGAVPILKKIYNSDNGLRGDATGYMQEDNDGNMWCVTPTALCKINLKTGSIVTFGKLDGIKNFNWIGGLFLFAGGTMRLTTQGGYYTFDPRSAEKKNKTVPLVVTSFKIDDDEQFFENKIAHGEKINISAHANVISFEFAALDFDRPDKQQYAYMLEGVDKNWVMAGQRRYAAYSNIQGGDYVFKVKATNTPDDWNTPFVEMPIHVEQPFYKTWWFIFIVFVTVVVSLYSFYKFRLEKQRQILQLQMKAKELEKEKALAMYENLKQHLNPHFLFNSLTSLSSLIRFDQKIAGDFLDGLSKIYRYILKSRDAETVTLLEEIKFAQTFVKLQQTRFNHGLQVCIEVSEEYHQCKIVPVTLQNFIENAIKHNIIDEELPLFIEISIEKNYLVVRNNLQKKDFVETSNKQGLTNIKSLYHYLTNKPIIITEDEKYFSVKIPLL
jgi:ligand-binding sensor domain-containing protein